MLIQDTHTFESDEGFDAVKYAEVCIFSETVNENGRMKESKEGRRECKHYTKIVHKVRLVNLSFDMGWEWADESSHERGVRGRW